MASSSDFEEATFAELKSFVSDWYHRHVPINMLKVWFKDHVPNTFELHTSSKMIELMHKLTASGSLSATDLTLLYDTIKATGQFGLEDAIKRDMPSVQLPKNIRDIVITKFTPHRQRLLKLGMALSPSDVQKISELYDVQHTDSWSLIMDLEHKTFICENNLDTFIDKLKTHNLHQAVKSLTEVLKLTLKRKCDKSQPHPEYILNILKEFDEYKGKLPREHLPKVYSKLGSICKFFKGLGFNLDNLKEGSIVIDLSTHNSDSLMHLWEIHSSGMLIKELAKTLVPEKHQQEFLDEWMTHIDENKYKAALIKLKGKDADSLADDIGLPLAKVDETPRETPLQTREELSETDGTDKVHDFYIISDDDDWDKTTINELEKRRPGIRCISKKDWIVGKSELQNLIEPVNTCKKVVVGFSPSSSTGNPNNLAQSLVQEMVKNNNIDEGKLIPVRITEDAIIPKNLNILTKANCWEENVYERLLLALDKGKTTNLTTQLDMKTADSIYSIDNDNEEITVTKGQPSVVKASGKQSATEVEYQRNAEYKTTSTCNVEGEKQTDNFAGEAHIKGSPGNINLSKYKKHDRTNKVADVVLDTEGCLLVSSYSKEILKFDESGSFVANILVPHNVNVNRMYVIGKDCIMYSDYRHSGKCVVMCDNLFQTTYIFGKENLKRPEGMAVNMENEVLYVADHDANCVVKFNIKDGSLQGKIGFGLKNPHDVTLTKEGHVIVADTGNNQVKMFNATDKLMRILVGNGKEDGKVKNPHGVTMDEDENIVVSSNHKLQVFDKNGVFIKRIDHEDDGLHTPAGMTLFSNKPRRVAVANNNKNNVKIFSASVNMKREKVVHTIGHLLDYKESAITQVPDEGTNEVTDVVTDEDKYILVASSKYILKFNQSGWFVARIQMEHDGVVNRMHVMSDGCMVYSNKKYVVMCDKKLKVKRLFGKGILKHPCGLIVNMITRVLYVADQKARCVFKFNLINGKHLGEIVSNGKMMKPYDVTLTKGGHLIVADFGNHEVKRFNEEDKLMKILVSSGKEDGKVWHPCGVAVDENENIIVSSNHKLQLFNKNGVFQKRIDHEDDGLYNPSAITISNESKRVLVANSGENNVKIFMFQ